jgi:hypothetical protein
MKTFCSSVILSLVTALLTGCDLTNNGPEEVVCQPPTTLIAQAPCESGYSGVLLVASGYSSNSPIQFIYNIFPQKDTLSNDVSKSAYANASNERFIVSDAVLKDAPKFTVRVTINCNGRDEGLYFSFVKRPAANPSCYVWALQKL